MHCVSTGQKNDHITEVAIRRGFTAIVPNAAASVRHKYISTTNERKSNTPGIEIM